MVTLDELYTMVVNAGFDQSWGGHVMVAASNLIIAEEIKKLRETLAPPQMVVGSDYDDALDSVNRGINLLKPAGLVRIHEPCVASAVEDAGNKIVEAINNARKGDE
jgi:hypothetical protein